MVIVTVEHHQWPEYSKLRKCGSIVTSADLDLMGFVCQFCMNTTICTRWEEFSLHMRRFHGDHIADVYKNGDAKQSKSKEGNDVIEIVDNGIRMQCVVLSMDEDSDDESGHKQSNNAAEISTNNVTVLENAVQIDGQNAASQQSTHNATAEFIEHNNCSMSDTVVAADGSCANYYENFIVEEILQEIEDENKHDPLPQRNSNSLADRNDPLHAMNNAHENIKEVGEQPHIVPHKLVENYSQEYLQLTNNAKVVQESMAKVKNGSSSSSNYSAKVCNGSDYDANDEHDYASSYDELADENYETAKRKRKKSTLPHMNMDSIENRPIFSYILGFYAKHAMLWDSNHAEYNNKEFKIEIFYKLSTDIHQKFRMTYTLKQLHEIFSNLRLLYRRELTSDEGTINKHKDVALHSQLWCFDQMEFLQKCTKAQTNKKERVVLEHQQMLQLVEILKSHPHLWNMKLMETRKKPCRRKALQQFMQETNEKLGLQFSETNIKSQLKYLKSLYTKQKRKLLSNKKDSRRNSNHYSLYEHMDYLNEHIGPFKCEKCEKIVSSYDQHLKHVNNHDGKKAYVCPECGKDFDTFSNLEVHIRRHTGDKPYKCGFESCNKAFACSNELDTHNRIHTGEKPYVCHICGMAFRASTLLTHHQQRHDPSKFRYPCPHCPKKFSEKNLLREHINSHLKLREHVCKTCGKGFFALKTLKQHEQLHSDFKKYECDECGKRFKQISAMYSHKKSHRNYYTKNRNIFDEIL